MSPILYTFILYLIIILVIGIITYKRNKSHQDFIIGSRSLNPWLMAFSERASGESAWLLLGLPGLAYSAGFIGIWDALGCVSGIIFYWYVVAKKLREQSEIQNSITLPDFFAEKFTDLKTPIRITATLITTFFFTFYLAAQFNGAGKVLNVTFGISQETGIIIGASVIVIYTMMGGFFAVVWTDMVQAIIMVGALVILPLTALVEILEQYKSAGEILQCTGDTFLSVTAGKTGLAGAAVIISGLSWGLGYTGQPHLLTRFMSIRKVSDIKISRRIAFIWAIPAFSGAVLIGLVGLIYYGQGAFNDVEYIMPQLAKDLLPAWLSGIFISGAIAAMMSTADSQLLVITSSVIEDFYHKTLGNKQVSEKTLLKLSRYVTIIVGILGLIISFTDSELIFEMVSYAWGGLGSSFGPALLLILWWKKTSAPGILAGMASGTIMTIVWRSEFPDLDKDFSARLVAWVFSFIIVIIVSLITKRKTTAETTLNV